MRLGICFNPADGTKSGSQQTIADYLIPEIVRQHPNTILFTASPERFAHLDLPGIVALPGRSVSGQRVKTALGMVRNYWGIPDAIEKSGCDIVYYPYTMEVLHRPISARQVVTVHDVIPLVYPKLFPRTSRLWRRKLLPALRDVDAIITPSMHAREMLLAQGGFEGRRIRAVNQGFRPVGLADEARAAAETNGEPPYILYVSSSHYPHKNVATLIRAFDRLRNDIPHRLVILATRHAAFTPPLDALVASLESRDRIVFTAEVTEDRLRDLYQRASLFAYPSELEGFGIPPLEAMSAGVPVVASNAASIPEVCGGAALYFSPWDETGAANAMRAVLTDPALEAELRRKGLEQTERFSWKRTARELLALTMEAMHWPAVGSGRIARVS